MRNIITALITFVMLVTAAYSAIYYVDGAAGNDNSNGLSLATAWKTIHKANQTLMPGDTVFIRVGTYHVGNLLGWAGADPSKQGINPKKGQVLQIKSLTQSAIYSGGAWSGTFNMQPGQGYAIKMNAPGTLTYPAAASARIN